MWFPAFMFVAGIFFGAVIVIFLSYHIDNEAMRND